MTRSGPIEFTTEIGAAPERVWEALVDPEDVTTWDGAVPVEIPPGYPIPGQHARWRTRLGPFPVTLHDRIVAVTPGARLVSSIDYGFVHVDEEYRLERRAGGRTVLTTRLGVRARPPGLGAVARRLVASGTEAAMARLRELCEGDRPVA